MADPRPCPRRGGPRSGPPFRGRFVSGLARALTLALAAGAPGACGEETRPPSEPPASPAAPARRVVSLAPSHTELLFALGAGDSVVGVTRFCDRPPGARTRTVVGDAVNVSLERIAVLGPDLVVVNADGLEAALEPLRVRVLRVSTDTLPQLLDAVGVLGRAVGREAEAAALRRRMEGALAAGRERGKGRPPVRVVVVVQREPFYVAGGGSYVHSLLETLGYRNAAGEIREAWPAISAEALVRLAPEAVIEASPEVMAGAPAGRPGPGQDKALLAYWRKFPGIPAVRDGRVLALRDEAALRPGPDVEAALAALEASVAPAPAGVPR